MATQRPNPNADFCGSFSLHHFSGPVPHLLRQSVGSLPCGAHYLGAKSSVNTPDHL